MNLKTKSLMFLSAAALLWSLSGVLVKSIQWNPLAIASSRSLVACFTILFLARKDIFRGPQGPWLGKGQVLAGVFLALVSVTFVSATKLTTAANAILLQYTAPVWVALLAPLVLRERTSGRDWLFMLAAMGGMVMFFMDSLSLDGLWGNILGLLSGVFFAALALTVRYLKHSTPVKGLIVGNVFTFLAGLAFWGPPWPGPVDIALILLAGTAQFGLSYYLYGLAAKGVTSLEMVLVPAIEPILSPVWVFLAIGERPGDWALAGGLVVLLTITLLSVMKVRAS